MPRGGLHSLEARASTSTSWAHPKYSITLYPQPLFSPHLALPQQSLNERILKQSTAAFIMPSIGQATSSTQADNVQLIIDALADYTKETGFDLSNNPFAAKFKQSSSPEAILQLLQEREKAFKGYRNENRRLINCLNPTVKVLHRFSGILSGVAGQVSRTGHPVNHLT